MRRLPSSTTRACIWLAAFTAGSVAQFARHVSASEADLRTGVANTEGISLEISPTDPGTMVFPSAETTELDAT